MQVSKPNLNFASLVSIVLSVSLFVLTGCYPESGPPGNGNSPTAGTAGVDMPDGGDTGGTSSVPTGKCLPVTATTLEPRSSIIGNDVAPTTKTIYYSDVFNAFKVQCGACHVEASDGDFQIKTPDDALARLRDPMILDRIQTTVLADTMPQPSTIVYSQRTADDPVRRLVQLLTEWAAAGYPPDLFYEKADAGNGASPYAMSADIAKSLTNIGTCIPSADFPFATDRVTMQALDDKFAAIKPAALGSTASAQAKLGLPLDLADTDLTSFDSDVLARQGVIAFQPAYPLWSDDSGKLRYIRVPLGKSVTFNAATQHFDIPDNTRFYKTFLKEVTDTTGNQRWRKIETRVIVARADIVAADGTHTPQALFGTYEWDESETHATLLIDTLRDGDPFTDHLFEYVTDEPKAAQIQATKPKNLTYEYEYEKVIRHYAVPGSNRCIECHMGSSNSNFIIGFTPLQINRQKVGDQGVYESASKDELGQLQRFIDIGLITGLKSASDIKLLSDSQGARKPRNPQELKAQAYMLANCSHCHNPNGYPSVASPVLKPILNFYPGADVGGIFQFPLELFSPRIGRGWDGGQIAYITPSMRDIVPEADSFGVTTLNTTYTPKFLAPDTMGTAPPMTTFMNAPWRSLIYRNTQTPFTYEDAYTLYPHMPFNTAGHDCRAAQWLGEWMVSIPAVRKHPELSENDHALDQDTEPQPYIEVLPSDAGYAAAVVAANKRLAIYKADPHYSTCPDTSDIVDPDVPSHTMIDGVPDRPNWVVTDLTERPGLWQPRRSDWQDVFVNKPNMDDQIVSTLLSSVTLKNVDGFANTKVPLGLWQQKPGCNFSSVRKASDFAPNERPQWFTDNPPAPTAPVFEVLPGQAVFDMICINCHGPNADSLGRQADTLQNLTGGLARVANFRYGLFNPSLFDDPDDNPDRGLLTNRQRVFGPVASPSVSVDDWGARYLSWMALGGTQVHLPQVILDQVQRTDVAGQARLQPFNITDVSANMLQVAQAACQSVLGFGLQFDVDRRIPNRLSSSLIIKNGDAALWSKLCSYNNPSPVHKLLFDTTHTPPSLYVGPQLYEPSYFPENTPIGDQNGNIVAGLSPDNEFPWCLDADAKQVDVPGFAHDHAFNGLDLPICPEDLGTPWSSTIADDHKMDGWWNRGAMNAGLSVFVFLDQFITGKIQHIGYDECEKLSAPN